MQPYLFPYIGYFQLINAADVFVIYDDVNYIKKGWINRNNILVNGKCFLFSVPLKEMSQNRLINQIEINQGTTWINDLLKTLVFSYKKAPFFADVFPIIEDVILYEKNDAVKWLCYSLQKVCDFLSIKTFIIISSEIHKNKELKGQDKIIEICKKLKATQYINPIGGLELYDKVVFSRHSISLNFVKSNPIIYQQFKNEFIPWLSIIDVLMFNSPQQIKAFLNQYELI